MATKYLTLAGLTTYDGLIKSYIGEADAKAIKYGKIEDGYLKLYKAENPGSTATPDFNLQLPSVDLTPYELKSHAGDIPAGATATTITGYVDEAADAAQAAAEAASVVSISQDGLVVTIKQGGDTAEDIIGTINIPADMVVASGAVETYSAGHLPSGVDEPGTYLVLTLANSDNQKVYINVADLIDTYTAAPNATQVQLAVNGRVLSASIVAGSITATELASGAVTTVKLDDAAVTNAKLASDAVQTANIVDANVTAAKLATDSVITAKIADGNVTTAKLAASAVETAKIADGNVTAAKLGTDSVTTVKIADANVTKAKLASTVQASLDLADSALQPEDLVVITDAEIEALFPSA